MVINFCTASENVTEIHVKIHIIMYKNEASHASIRRETYTGDYIISPSKGLRNYESHTRSVAVTNNTSPQTLIMQSH